ncbi:DoxX family membrane protein [Paenibacillus radicis (ex Xue et al. 2023)]|uniref:DoxX family membrane protein n=1 Tax=Paenibacillus radicis (ex Xue et al. 2023) TaxID=2972489 RepID=A0ABT1YRR2_9BACL|nr:DoxX family membrane protein [Paenibacillus radicis (ex Xue et al. 2023)]MCR8635859.1 DoxX family membrane protein [Paenibacillus radicis (ex Xue et al. 2023)]
MMLKWVQENVYAAWLLLIVRLYVGYEWVTGGWHKLTAGFDATGFIKGAVTKPLVDKATNELIYPTYTAFLQNFALPNAKLFNIIIPFGELLVGLGLILGALTTAAAFFGILMNFMFMFAGTVSTNPWMILLGTIVFVAGTNAGRWGVDYYLMPYIRKALHRRNKGDKPKAVGGGTHTPNTAAHA